MHLVAMKQIILTLFATVSVFSLVCCERHQWEDSADGAKDGTKNLFPKEEKKHDTEDAHDPSSHEGHDH